MQSAEEMLRSMLRATGLPVRGSYCRSEVCKLMGMSTRTFWRKTGAYEPGRPECLSSFVVGGHRRVPYGELVSYLDRQNSYRLSGAD